MSFLKVEFSQNRLFGLDLLRAIAIFFVVYGHGIDIFSDHNIRKILEFAVFDGVSIFFVLSGFLIGNILIKTVNTKPINLSTLLGFWKRRWFRTLPNYLLVLTVIYTISENNRLTEFIKYSLFLQNFNTPHPFFFPEAWSLSIEEWFYLLIPMGLFFVLKVGIKHQKAILFIIISVILTSVLIRYYKFWTTEIESAFIWHTTFRMQVVTRMDSIMFGILGAYLSYYHSSLWLRHKKGCLLLGIILLVIDRYSIYFLNHIFTSSYYSIYSFWLSSIGTLLLLPFLSNYKQKNGKLYRAITIISLISYSMYLINFSLVRRYLIPRFTHLISSSIDGLALDIYTYSAYWCTTIFLSIIIYKYYEVPFTSLRDKPFLINAK